MTATRRGCVQLPEPGNPGDRQERLHLPGDASGRDADRAVAARDGRCGNYAIVSTYTAPAGATSVGVAPGGWENLAIIGDSNPELTHTLLLGYGVVNWVTKGVFLGERKIYMTAQPDDLLIPDDLWDPVTKTTPNDGAAVSNPVFRYRNTGTDYTSLVAWQTAFQATSQDWPRSGWRCRSMVSATTRWTLSI